MARDRRRAKQRRERQSRSGSPSAQGADGNALPQDNPLHEHEPAEFASGEVDLADARLATSRPERSEPDVSDDEPLGGSTTDELFEHALDDDGSSVAADGGGRDGGDGGETAVAPLGGRSPEPKQRREGSRFVNFLRGSWRELQRVQWPDRPQVAQATAVVIGFVLIAGGFLGLADWLSSRIVDLIV